MSHVARDGARMAEVARGDLTAPVPTCPGWTLRDLIEHCGFVHRWQTAAVRDRPAGFPDADTWEHGPGDGESWADWFQGVRGSATDLLLWVWGRAPVGELAYGGERTWIDRLTAAFRE